MVRATSEILGLDAGNMKSKMQNDEGMRIRTIICIILPLCSSIYHVHYKYTDIRNLFLKKCNLQHSLGCRHFWLMFTKRINNVSLSP